jgi:hypothetical protein
MCYQRVMKGAAVVFGLAFGLLASPARAAPAYACLETATGSELRVDLGAGEGGAWKGELVLTTVGGASEIAGTVFDTTKLAAKGRKPPKLRLKSKPITDAQRGDLLRGLTEAIGRAEEAPICESPVPHAAKVTWSCSTDNKKTGGDQSFEGDRCGSKANAYPRAVAIADWAVAALKRHGAR